VAEENDVELAPSKSGVSVKTLIIIGVIVVILIAASIGITVFILSGNSDKNNSNEVEQTESVDSEQTEIVTKPAIYFLLKPDFIINFESDGKANFLSVQIEIMARDDAPINIIEAHMPVIRNNVLLLLSAQKYDVVRTLAGKKILRQEILNIMKEIIDKENNKLKEKDEDEFHKIAYIEAVYFTGFIMQ